MICVINKMKVKNLMQKSEFNISKQNINLYIIIIVIKCI